MFSLTNITTDQKRTQMGRVALFLLLWMNGWGGYIALFGYGANNPFRKKFQKLDFPKKNFKFKNPKIKISKIEKLKKSRFVIYVRMRVCVKEENLGIFPDM